MQAPCRRTRTPVWRHESRSFEASNAVMAFPELHANRTYRRRGKNGAIDPSETLRPIEGTRNFKASRCGSGSCLAGCAVIASLSIVRVDLELCGKLGDDGVR